jgi:hypothetical protein
MTHPDRIPGHPENIEGSPNPSFDCLTGRCLLMSAYDATEIFQARIRKQPRPPAVAEWCLWCGGGVSNPDRIDDETGQALDFTPAYALRVPEGWHREPERKNNL